jgi:hypothetical protein
VRWLWPDPAAPADPGSILSNTKLKAIEATVEAKRIAPFFISQPGIMRMP